MTNIKNENDALNTNAQETITLEELASDNNMAAVTTSGVQKQESTAAPLPNGTPLPKFASTLNNNKLKEVDVGSIISTEKKNEEENVPEELRGLTKHQRKAIDNIDNAIDRLAKESAEIAAKGKAIRDEKAAMEELDGDDESDVNAKEAVITPADSTNIDNNQNHQPSNVSVYSDKFDDEDDEDDKPENKKNIATYEDDINLGLDDDDFDLLEEEEKSQEDDREEKIQEVRETIRQNMKEKFKPIHNAIDFSKFTISKKPISISKVITDLNERPIEGAIGVIYAQKRAVKMSALSAVELETLRPPQDENVNRYDYITNRLKLIYSHLIDDNKPNTFELWAKSTYRDTIDDYFFTLYKATFGKSNIITYTCDDNNCNNVFMLEEPIEDMIKFKDEATKQEYYRILRTGNVNTESTEYDTQLFQISDDYAVTLKKPSLYSSYVEPSLLDTEFLAKHEDFMLLMSYIDDIYLINREDNTLNKIDTKPIPGQPTKSIKRKIRSYHKILNSLNSDQIQALSFATDKIDDLEIDPVTDEVVHPIVYQYPSEKCGKCGRVIEASEEAPDRMLFMRHRLGLMLKM